jgi:hypothetical protein
MKKLVLALGAILVSMGTFAKEPTQQQKVTILALTFDVENTIFGLYTSKAIVRFHNVSEVAAIDELRFECVFFDKTDKPLAVKNGVIVNVPPGGSAYGEVEMIHGAAAGPSVKRVSCRPTGVSDGWPTPERQE